MSDRTIVLSDELHQDQPLAWGCFTDNGEWEVYVERCDADDAAEDDRRVWPLYAAKRGESE